MWVQIFFGSDFIIIIIIPIQAFLTQLVCHLLDEGNSCYRDGDWQQATQQYSEGISVARYAQAEALVIPYELLECLYVNRAAAFYQAVRHSAIFTAICSIRLVASFLCNLQKGRCFKNITNSTLAFKYKLWYDDCFYLFSAGI